MLPDLQKTDTETNVIISYNNKEWERLLLLFKNPEPNIFWFYCDTAVIKKPLHDLITLQFPQWKPIDIYLDKNTESLNKILFVDYGGKIQKDHTIHIFGIEDAVKNIDFVGNLNFNRDSLFRNTPCNLIFWADFDTSNILSHRAYDFWSWMFLTFDFNTPQELLTARQRSYESMIFLEDKDIKIPSKDSANRIEQIKHEWEFFLEDIGGKPTTIKQLKDAITLAVALGNEYEENGNYKESAAILEKVLAISEQTDDENTKNLVYNNLGNIYRELGQLNQAKVVLERAMRNSVRFFGYDYPYVSVSQSNLACVLRELGQYNEAKELLEKALESCKKQYEGGHPNIAIIQSNLAVLYQDLGELLKAKELLENVMESETKNLGENHPTVATSLSNLAYVYLDLGEYHKAKILLEKAIENLVHNFGANHMRTRLILTKLDEVNKIVAGSKK